MPELLEKYIGKYRILPEVGERNGKPEMLKENLYIPCYKGSQIYHYGGKTLAIYIDNVTTAKRWFGEGKGLFEVLNNDPMETGEIIFLFQEKDMEKVAKIVKPMVKGRNIHPHSKRNMSKDKSSKYEIKYPKKHKALKDKILELDLQIHQYRQHYKDIGDKMGVDLAKESSYHGLKIIEYIDMEDLYKEILAKMEEIK